MKHFKVVGDDSVVCKSAERLLDKINFEENVLKIISESFMQGISFEETLTYKDFITEIKKL